MLYYNILSSTVFFSQYLALEAMRTLANEVPSRSRHRHAGAVMLTRVDSARIVFPITIIAHEVPGAIAGVSINAIDAGTAVLAWL